MPLLDGTDEVRHRVVVVGHANLDDGARRDDIARRRFDHDRVLEELLDMADTRLVVALLVLRRVEVGVLTNVTVLACLLDPRRDFLAPFVGALLELVFEAPIRLG